MEVNIQYIDNVVEKDLIFIVLRYECVHSVLIFTFIDQKQST